MFKQNILKTKKIATKFLSWFLLVALLPLFFFGYLNYSNSKKSLQNEVMNNLIAIADKKVHYIETYIFKRKKDALMIARIPSVVSAMEAFKDVVRKYGMDSPQYLDIDKQFSKSFSDVEEIFGLYDLFLITLDGDVIFTVEKEDDYGTNLKTGNYKNSELAKSFSRARTLLEIDISDFNFYGPSNRPAAFITVPILKNKNIIGVFALQMRPEDVYELTKDYKGLGETGETVLAMKKGDEVVFVAPTRHNPLAAFGQKIDFGSQKAYPIQEASQGRRGFGKSIDYRDTEVLAVWRYLPHLRWGVVVKIDTEEAFVSVFKLRNWLLIFGIMIIFVVTLVALLVSKSISDPIIKLTQTTELIAGGDLTPKINIASDDEIGQLGNAFNKMVEDLKISRDTMRERSQELEIVNEQLRKEVTERKRIEDALQREKEFSRRVIETADVLILGFDLKGKVILFNRKAEEVTGYSREEVIGKIFFKTIFPEKKETILTRIVQEIVAGKAVKPQDIPFITKGGEEKIIYSGGTPLKDSEGKITGVIGIGSDVTELRSMQQRVLQSEKLKSLGELAGGVAHNFNNLLAVILGNAQLLKMIVEPPPGGEERRKSVLELKRGLEIIESASRDGAEVVRRINAFTRARDGKGYVTVNLSEVIDHTLEFTKIKWKDGAESKGIAFNIQRDFSSLPPLEGSDSELREVFTNIINNAVDAMPQGGEIKIKTFKEDRHIVVKIEDKGVGIPRAIRDRIFDPFFTTKGVQSTGLGMSVSYGIINRHKGTIMVDSVEGEGTTFTIKLPIPEKIIETEKIKRIEVEQRKATILVIEDEEGVRNLLSAILTKGGHEVEIATNGNQGIEMFEKKEFDLVFTDLGMPEMSGWQVAEKVKAVNGRVPVVLITGWNVELEESELRERWVDLVIQKPFEVDKILRLVQEGMILKDKFKKA